VSPEAHIRDFRAATGGEYSSPSIRTDTDVHNKLPDGYCKCGTPIYYKDATSFHCSCGETSYLLTAALKSVAGKGLKYDTGKLRYSLVPPVAIKGIAEVLTFGASKYGKDNWQLVDNAEERYLDALYRHLEAYRAGESHDPESGLTHLAHAATNVAFLQYFEDKKPTTTKEV